MRHTTLPVIVDSAALAELHQLRRAAGLAPISDGALLQYVATQGIAAEAESLRLLVASVAKEPAV